MSEQDQRALYSAARAADSLGSQISSLDQVVNMLNQTLVELSYELGRLNEHNERQTERQAKKEPEVAPA